jgi:hypothetical protein
MRLRYLCVFLVVSLLIPASLFAGTKVTAESPTPSILPTPIATTEVSPLGHVVGPEFTPGLSSSAECMHFEDNSAINGGYLFIPPDPSCAAGSVHILDSGNCYVEWRLKGALVDTPQQRIGINAFYTGTPGALPLDSYPTNVFDTRCTYDRYSGRFIVVSLQQVTSPSLQSRILIAVSKTSDPNDGWWLNAINSTLTIGGVARWADYPCLGFDDDAIYVCANMFNAAGTNYAGPRLWIVDKASVLAGPNGGISAPVYDFVTLSGATADLGVGTTTMPASMWGSQPTGVGTFLVQTGWSAAPTEYVAIFRVDTPAAPSFNYQLLSVGDISNGTVPNATQMGGTRTIATVSQRVMSAVWRNDNLYTCNTIKPTTGVDQPQATVHWYRIDTSDMGALVVADQGNVGGEDIATGTHTFMPAIHVDRCDNMAISFSASGPSIYASAYYATRAFSDPAGTIGASQLLAAGQAYYIRTFSSSTTAASRWGDFGGLSLCPVDEGTFWVYNEYAGTQGTPTTVGSVTENGRWWTRVGSFVECQTVAVAVSSFDALANDDMVTLRAEFRSDLRVQAVNVYRADGDGSMIRIDTIGMGGTDFVYTDRVAPGTYSYQIGVVDADGEFMSQVANVTVSAFAVAIDQNIPNPFNPATTIRYTMAERSNVTINVYDASGRLVRTLVDGARDAGAHDVMWDGRDNNNSPVTSGVYFYRLTTGTHSESKKMVLLK